MSEILLTYAEMADRMGIKPSSAKKLATRKKWLRVIGNDGLARVRVPLERVSPVSGDVSGDVSLPSVPDVSLRVAHLEGLLEGVQGQLEAERKRADAAEARVKDVEADREAWKAQAQRSLWSRLFS